jgi:hypothetical protein
MTPISEGGIVSVNKLFLNDNTKNLSGYLLYHIYYNNDSLSLQEYGMPLMSSFLGILVYMFKEKNSPHHMPHVHAVFGSEKCL